MDSDEEVLMEFLMSTDSENEVSSSSSEDEEFLLLLGTTFIRNSRVAVHQFVENVIPQYTEEQFIMLFRIRRDLFNILCENFRNSIFYKQSNLPSHVSPKKYLSLFLWFMGHQISYREIANLFDLSVSTSHYIVKKVTEFLVEMAPEVIKWPTIEEQREISDFFYENKQFPNVAGCIDGTHIKIERPQCEVPESYINRKGFYSIQMQIICDHKKKIRDIFLGYPGSVHDARVFYLSDVPNYGNSLIDNGKYIIGDSAYPCLEFLLVPYKDDGFLTNQQKKFNKTLSSCRVFVEHTIGILKERFRQLQHLRTKKINLLVAQIKSCCVLHNLCSEDAHFEFEIIEGNNDLNPPQGDLINDEMKQRGRLLRDVICDSL